MVRRSLARGVKSLRLIAVANSQLVCELGSALATQPKRGVICLRATAFPISVTYIIGVLLMKRSNRFLIQGLLVLGGGVFALATPRNAEARLGCDEVYCISVGFCETDPSGPPANMCDGGCGGPICSDDLIQCGDGDDPGYICAFAS